MSVCFQKCELKMIKLLNHQREGKSNFSNMSNVVMLLKMNNMQTSPREFTWWLVFQVQTYDLQHNNLGGLFCFSISPTQSEYI